MGFMFMGRVNGINQYKHGSPARTCTWMTQATVTEGRERRYVPGDWGVELGKMEACLARLDASLATPDDESLSFGSVTHCSNKGFRF